MREAGEEEEEVSRLEGEMEERIKGREDEEIKEK